MAIAAHGRRPKCHLIIALAINIALMWHFEAAIKAVMHHFRRHYFDGGYEHLIMSGISLLIKCALAASHYRCTTSRHRNYYASRQIISSR